MLTIASGLAALAAAAFADPPAGSAGNGANAVVTLIDGWRLSDGSRVAGIAIDFDPSWHTYWRVPGEAGIPPDFDWSGSENLVAMSSARV